MKIAFFVYEFPPKIIGGLGVYAMEVTKRFILSGHEVSVFTMNDDEGSLPHREMWRGVEVYRPMHIDISDSLPHIIADDIKKWGRGISLFSKVLSYNILSAHEFIHEVVQKYGLKYDLVVVHDWLSVISAIAIKKELKLPFIFHIHSTEKGRTLGNGSEIIHGVEQKGGKDSDKIITVSHAMKNELKSMGLQNEKIEVCYNGVDADKYDPKKVDPEKISNLKRFYGVNEDEYLLLYLGRLVPVKGVDRLIMAMSRVVKELPKTKLLVIGVGAMEQYLRALIHRFNLQNNVKICPRFLTEEEKMVYYASCDLAVFPSLYEPFGIVALEAMSMGKPVVVGARGVSGMKEIVVPEGPTQCGFYTNPHDLNNLAETIIEALKNPENLEKIGRNGRERAKKLFSWDNTVNKTLKIYESLLSE